MRRPAIVLFVLLNVTKLIANPTQDENQKPGTSEWVLAHPAPGREIEGYASATSVNNGESIRLFVSTMDPAFTIEIFRMGWYGGTGGRRVTNAVQRTGHEQAIPSPDPSTGLIECNWTDPYEVTIPDDWVSGVYLAKLTGTSSTYQRHIMFVVRNDARKSDLLFQSSVTTMQGYNNWGGKSLYAFNSTGPQASKVSFDRPYADATGSNEFLFRYEYLAVRFLEREGYDVTYTTNIDTHARGDLIRGHKAFLSVGHDEYWSWQMRQNVEGARNAGVNIAFLGGNTCYWQIRLDNDLQGQPNRTIVAYKESALSSDPILSDGDPTNDYLATTLWRSSPVDRPEEQFVGVMTSIVGVQGDTVIENASHWVFSGTGLNPGDRLTGLEGHEVDRMFSAYPPNTVRLAHSPVAGSSGNRDFGDMTIYQAGSGAYVFAVGTMQWSWGLDNFADRSHGAFVSAAAQQITRNVLNRFLYGEPRAKRRSVARH